MIKVLVIDDSSTVRMILSQGLAKDPEIQVVGTAPDPYVARDKIAELNPDVLTLDVEMPRMDGIEFLKRIMAFNPIPVIMVSALTEQGKRITLEALEAGAVDFVTKPSGSHGGIGLPEMLGELRKKIKMAARVNPTVFRTLLPKVPTAQTPKSFRSESLAETTDKVIAIGASTGGTTAIRELLARLPADTPGVVVVQHITPGFTTMFADRLNDVTSMSVCEAKDGDRIITGRVLVAPSNKQMEVRRTGGFYYVNCKDSPPVGGHRPSVEALFQSVARSVGNNAIGVILTGMGGDGAEGLLAMKKAGARTIGQDEASCVVYGMPKVAWDLGGVEHQLPLEKIAGTIMEFLRRPTR